MINKDFINDYAREEANNFYHNYYYRNYETQGIQRIPMVPVKTKGIVKFTKYDWREEECIKLVKLPKTHVSDGIGQDYLSWTYGSTYIINSQTGTGKNFFTNRVLVEYAIKRGWKIIIFLNRVALARQVKKDLAKIQGISLPSDYTTRELDEREVFGCVTIKTYQSIINDLKNSPLLDMHFGKILDQDYDICVFDECHYYCSDSGMSSHTFYLMEKLSYFFCNKIKLYMTSTPNEVLPWIIKVETKKNILERSARLSNPILSSLYPYKITVYDFKRDYKYIIPRYFRAIEELVNKIKEDKTNKKWIIYVRSMEDGKEMVEKLGEEIAVFINAKSKEAKGLNNDTFNEIIEKEKFSKKCLVTTTVLDNGVNIKDSDLANIIIMSSDETLFLQALGRKRISNNEKVYLYIQELSKTKIDNFIKSIEEKLDAYKLFNENELEFKNECLNNPELHEKICKLFYFKNRNSIEWNPIAIKKLEDDKKRLEDISNRIKSGEVEAFIREQLSWIGLEKSFDKKNYINNKQVEDNLNDLIKYLEEMADKPLNKEEQNKLEQDFKEKCINVFGIRIGSNGKSKEVKKRGYGIDTIRERFITNELPYTIESAKGIWTIKRKVTMEVQK